MANDKKTAKDKENKCAKVDRISDSVQKKDVLEGRLRTSLTINVAYALAQLVIGLLVGSLAIVSNGGHTLADSFSIVVSLLAARISKRKATPRNTFGYGRVAFIAALANAVVLIVFVAYVFYFSYLRLLNPAPTSGAAIVATSIAGILVSGSIALLLRGHGEDLNVKSVFLHMTLDSLSLVGTMVAGFLILLTGNFIFDPLIGFAIGFVILFGAIGIVRASFNLLLEGVPTWIDPVAVRRFILKSPNVRSVHDLHIWAISSKGVALSCHVVMRNCELNECTIMAMDLKKKLKERFGIEHMTIESESETEHKKHKKMPV